MIFFGFEITRCKRRVRRRNPVGKGKPSTRPAPEQERRPPEDPPTPILPAQYMPGVVEISDGCVWTEVDCDEYGYIRTIHPI